MSYQTDCEAYTPEQGYRDAMDYEFNAQFDYVREAYGSTAEGLDDGDYDPDIPDLNARNGFMRILPSWEFRLCECAKRTGNDVRHL